MIWESDVRAVIAAYPADFQPRQILPLASAGGFSGALLWRLATPAGRLCLRRWPKQHPSRERLEYIQAVLSHVVSRGFSRVPAALQTRERRGFVQYRGFLWELTPWLPGAADYQARPSRNKLQAALNALARFHQAASSFPGLSPAPSASPGVIQRRQRLHDVTKGGCERLLAAVGPGDWPELEIRARRILASFPAAARRVSGQLAAAARSAVPLQPCIRDVWRDNILFAGDEVSGIVDFGAMRTETVAADIGRLLGSLAGDSDEDWRLGLQAYQSIRPLAEAELDLVRAFDQSTTVLAGINWLEWIYIEGGLFENRKKVLARLDEILARLEKLATSRTSLQF